MVLQRELPVAIWGWAPAGAEVPFYYAQPTDALVGGLRPPEVTAPGAAVSFDQWPKSPRALVEALGRKAAAIAR